MGDRILGCIGHNPEPRVPCAGHNIERVCDVNYTANYRGFPNCIYSICAVAGLLLLAEFLVTNFGSIGGNLKDEIECLRRDLMNLNYKFTHGISDLRRELEREHNAKESRLGKNMFNEMKFGLLDDIENLTRKIVREAIQLYDADKTGLADYALSSLEARATADTVDVPSFFEDRLHSVQCIISPIVIPGECWAFEGSKGGAIIQLIGKVYITEVSLEHIPAIISPTGEISNAPKEFSIRVIGMVCDDEDGTLLGKFEYDIHGDRLQFFKVKDTTTAYSHIEFRVHSNHGNSEYTCVYRIRVHGRSDLQFY
ncbi:hypothetical protein C0J52_18531 [Blattella germanica]|nr:hypothetical protein C0J52_18531 [Blattella germanica]